MIDAAAIARDTAALVQAPSLTGAERPALDQLRAGPVLNSRGERVGGAEATLAA